jgi:Ca2+-transporting ATPase
MPAVETLGCATVICSDKTGTLTKGEMTVRRVFAGGKSVEVSGVGYAPEGGLSSASNDPSLNLIFTGAILCNDSTLSQEGGKWSVKGDPTEGALVALGAKAGLKRDEIRAQYPRIGELPFSSDRKRMSTIHRIEGGKRRAFVKGAPEVILDRCSTLMLGEAVNPLDESERMKVLSANEEMASSALRVLAIAYKDLVETDRDTEELVEKDLTFLGLVGMMDPPREEAVEAVRVCRQVSIKPIMITGDHKLTAVAVAKELGIHREGDLVFTGEDLSKVDDEEFERVVNQVTVYARVSPLDKLKIIKAWKNRGEVVAMTGDGVNDAPALKHADIGIAMGITGTEVAKEAADIVLSDDNFATIVRAIERGRWIYDNIKKYLTYLLRANMTEVVVLGGVVMVMGPEYLPLLPAAILYINLATDGLPALALGVAPADPDIMRRPPRDPRESVFSKDLKILIIMAVIIECPLFLWMFFRAQPDMELARTLIFFMFVFIELIIAVNFRSLRYSLIQAPPHKWLLIAIGWELALILILVQFPAVRNAFGITLLSASDFGMIFALGVGIVIVIEMAKAVFRMTAGGTAMAAYAERG